MDFAATLAGGQSLQESSFESKIFEVCVFKRLKGCFYELIENNRKVSFWKVSGTFGDDPCENWRVTCEGLSFVKYGVNNGSPVTINGRGAPV